MSEMLERQDDGDPFSDVVMARLREAVSAAAWDDDHPALDAALRVLIAESRRRGLAPERVVLILKRIWRTTHRPPDMGAEEWDLMYRDAVDTKLAMYFEDTRPACPRPRTSARTSIGHRGVRARAAPLHACRGGHRARGSTRSCDVR